MGTRRSLDSPCVGPGAHGEVSIRRVLSVRYVFSSRRTAKVLFTVCPRKSTWQTLRHTANSRFPVVPIHLLLRSTTVAPAHTINRRLQRSSGDASALELQQHWILHLPQREVRSSQSSGPEGVHDKVEVVSCRGGRLPALPTRWSVWWRLGSRRRRNHLPPMLRLHTEPRGARAAAFPTLVVPVGRIAPPGRRRWGARVAPASGVQRIGTTPAMSAALQSTAVHER